MRPTPVVGSKAAGGPARTMCSAALALLAALALTPGCQRGESPAYNPYPKAFTPLVDLGKGIAPSSDQQELMETLGQPSHFWVNLDPRSGDRVETWTWFAQGEEATFHNGKLIRRREAEDESGSYPPTVLRPQDLSTGTTLQDLEESLGAPYFNSHTELEGKQVLILFYTGAVVTFTEGSFSSIDTMVHPFEALPLEQESP